MCDLTLKLFLTDEISCHGIRKGIFSPQNIKTTITHFHAEHNVISVQYGSCAEIKMHKLTAPFDDFIRCLLHLNWLEILSLSSFSLIPIWHNYHHCMKVLHNHSKLKRHANAITKNSQNYVKLPSTSAPAHFTPIKLHKGTKPHENDKR